MKKIQNKMHTLRERIQEYGVRISSFYLFQLNTSTTQHLNILVFPSSPGATTWHEGLSWKLPRISAYGVRLKYERTKYYAWENHPSVSRGNLISYSFSTQHLNLSTTQHFGVSILTWCCVASWRSILKITVYDVR